MLGLAWILVPALGVAFAASAQALTVDFEGLADGAAVTTQIAGATFSNAVVLSSGLTLNEFEFPPHSGVSVASDDGGAMQIVFDAPATAASAFFTYTSALTLTAFDAGGNSVATAASLFANNTALSGVAGSNANELISLAAAVGITRITILGDVAGGSFVVDDLVVTAVPEASTYALMLSGLLLVAWMRSRRLREQRS